MGSLGRRAAVRVAVAAGVGVVAAGMPAVAGAARAVAAAAVSGTWGTAQEVPGTASLNAGGFAVVTSVSCASAGNCSAAGSYDGAGDQQVFVVTQTNGTWGTAEQVPGLMSHGDSWQRGVWAGVVR